MKKTYFFKQTIIMMMLLGTTVVQASSFSDIDNHWAKNVIIEMKDKEILDGFSDGTFRPDEKVTREQFAKILVETLDLEEISEMQYDDVEENRWSKDYILKACDYMSLYVKEGKYYFEPERYCKRGDVAAAIVAAMKLEKEEPNYDVLNQFDDLNEMTDKYAIAIAVENGIMKGKGGYFDSTGYLTRAEVSQILYNLLEKQNEDSKGIFKDFNVKINGNQIDENLIIDLESRLLIDGNGEIIEIISNQPVNFDNSKIIVQDSKGKNVILYAFGISETQNSIRVHAALEPGEKYTILVSNIVDVNGKYLEDVSFRFNTSGNKRIQNKKNIKITIDANKKTTCNDIIKIAINRPLKSNEFAILSFDTKYGTSLGRNSFMIENAESIGETFINIKASEIVKYFEEYNGIDPKLLNNEELKITLQIQDLSKQNLTIIESKTVTTTLLTTKKYTILEKYRYEKTKAKEGESFVEIRINNNENTMCQESDITITPEPDFINEDEFGNRYAFYDLANMKKGEQLEVIIERNVTLSFFDKEVSQKANAEILDGFEKYLQPQERIDSNYEKIVLKAKDLTRNCKSDYEKIKVIFEYVSVNVESDLSAEYANKGSIAAIENLRGSVEENTTLFVAMCRALKIPARAITGYEIKDGVLVDTLRVEVYFENYGWVPVNPNIVYYINGVRKPYFNAFCKMEDINFVATGIYYYEKANRRLKGASEIELSKMIEN